VRYVKERSQSQEKCGKIAFSRENAQKVFAERDGATHPFTGFSREKCLHRRLAERRDDCESMPVTHDLAADPQASLRIIAELWGPFSFSLARLSGRGPG